MQSKIKAIHLREDEIRRLLDCDGVVYLTVKANPQPVLKGSVWTGYGAAWDDSLNQVYVARNEQEKGTAFYRAMNAPYQFGDVMYVCEPWNKVTMSIEGLSAPIPLFDDYIYKADGSPFNFQGCDIKWNSARSMAKNKDAVRLFVSVALVSLMRSKTEGWVWCLVLNRADKPEGWPSND